VTKRGLLILIILLLVVFSSGCQLIQPEVKTDIDGCRDAAGTPLFGSIVTGLVEESCKNNCQANGYSYKQWKCSSDNYFVCVCKRW